MTYAKKFGEYGIYTDNNLYRWFKNLKNARDVWDEWSKSPECCEELLEEFDSIRLVNMRTGEIIDSIEA